MVGEVYAQKMGLDDPLFIPRTIINNQNNYLHSIAREDKDRMYSKIYFAFSLVLTITASFFAFYLNWIVIIVLMDLLMILLVIFAKGYRKRRGGFWYNRKVMKKNFEDFGMEWRG